VKFLSNFLELPENYSLLHLSNSVFLSILFSNILSLYTSLPCYPYKTTEEITVFRVLIFTILGSRNLRRTIIRGVGFEAAIPTLGSVGFPLVTFNIFAVHFSHDTAAANHSLPTICVPTPTKPSVVITAASVLWVRLLTR
jgi:hypothetical protein